MSTKDHRENILQQSLPKIEQQRRQPQEQGLEGGGGGVEQEECKTPCSSDHKIPTIESCPPTPRKKLRVINFHKRKFSELQFFETTRSEEVESFFRSNSESFTVVDECSRGIKRRCRSA
ncbi:hypothetical protein PTKIN_Ptkin11bG0049700 [Pterospermum kingtungense]